MYVYMDVRIYMSITPAGRVDDQKTLQLLPKENYCLGSSGVVLSNGALRALAGKLPFCHQAIERHNSEGESLWRNWDVELGRCLSRRVGVQCSLSTEVGVCVCVYTMYVSICHGCVTYLRTYVCMIHAWLPLETIGCNYFSSWYFCLVC